MQRQKRQILNNLTYMWNLKILNPEKPNVECWLPGIVRKWGDIGQSLQNFSYKMNKF